MGCDQKMHHLVWPWCHHEILLFILFEQKWKYASFHTTNLIKTFEIFFLIYFRQVVMLLQVRLYSATISDTKIYIVDYPGLNHQVIAVQEDLKANGFNLWTLRSNIYLAYFHQNTVTFYTLDTMSNKSLVSLQESKHPIISSFGMSEDLALANQKMMGALHFYS